ncbi:hypothetical protein HanXRQr2_Chr05g0217621 [Helianthus annuus]|uniref:Uncharacterized protein n=1 Tax=Helianthus annuus TaxID=4232 RepID=A0A251UQZ1_HELAN|nr:hypothetical protein HanXRQr2_Chr05g0217621 [Helianthus annuus]KAJ0570429.1 hypothetical protein HanHA300_Chr05g0177871 [Helianthus annuus]KAJ0750432.1 hypothetical protein HanLR1_Chr05g0181921 [Helianthus annuus]
MTNILLFLIEDISSVFAEIQLIDIKMMLGRITPVSIIIRYDVIWRVELDGKMNSRCLIGLETTLFGG